MKNLKQKTEKKRTSTINCKQGERCDDVIVNELLDAQAATIGAWKLDNVIDQISVGKESQTNSSRSSSSQVSNAIKGTLHQSQDTLSRNCKYISFSYHSYLQVLTLKLTFSSFLICNSFKSNL